VAAVIVAGEWLGLMLNPAAPALRVRVLLHIAGVLVRGCRSRVTRRRGLRLSSGPRLASPLPRATRKWWGEATSTASDSKRFASWDSNLMTEFHARCGGCGVMIYWHVERGRLCVYSQLKSCSSSEADAVETAGLGLRPGKWRAVSVTVPAAPSVARRVPVRAPDELPVGLEPRAQAARSRTSQCICAGQRPVTWAKERGL
jgi:hypothetical protein